jgi:hypothetical protein
VQAFRLSQAVTYEVKVLFRGGDAPLRLFLEGVQDINGLAVANSVDRSPCAAYPICNNFNNRAAAKTSQRLCRRIGLTLLGGKQGMTNVAANFVWETAKVSPA